MYLIQNLKHLCFDKDGVLIDVHCYWKHTTEIRANYLKNKFQLGPDAERSLIDCMGIDLDTGRIKKTGPIGYEPRTFIVEKVKKCLLSYSCNSSKQNLAQYFLEIDEYQQKNNDFDINLLDGVKSFILQNSKKYKMTIFTSDRKKNAEIALTKLGINKFFSKILGGDSVKKSKPDPEGIINACKSVNISPSNTAYLTDTTSDLIMAESAEVLYKIGVETGLGTKKELIKHSDLVCKDLSELSNIFLNDE